MLTYERLRTVLRYVPGSGHFYWLLAISPNVHKGQRAGSLHSQGYINIKIDGRLYKGHRLAWCYVEGYFPEDDVEHRDLCRSNNRWRNLRLADDSKNQANTPRRSDNTSGFKSISRRKDSGKWRARI